jgi:hypothetical protein
MTGMTSKLEKEVTCKRKKHISKAKARKTSRYQYKCNKTDTDYCDYVENIIRVHIFREGGDFVVRHRDIARTLRHRSYYQLCRIVHKEWCDYNLTKVQRRYVNMNSTTNKIVENAKATLKRLGIKTFPVSGCKQVTPQPLAKIKGMCEEVKEHYEHIKKNMPKEVMVEIDKYEHSSSITDIPRLAKPFTLLVESVPKDMEFDDYVISFIRMAIEHDPCMYDAGEYGLTEMMSQKLSNASAGLMPLNAQKGKTTGSKNDLQAAAAAINLLDKEKQFPKSLVVQIAQKAECLKSPKPMRGIGVESAPNHCVLKHFFDYPCAKAKDIASGSGIGLSTLNGDHKIFFFVLYNVYSEYHPGCLWNDFLEWLDKQSINESDYEQWESHTGYLDMYVYVQTKLCQIKTPTDLGTKRLLARAFADFMNPAIHVDHETVYYAPAKITSGGYFTSDGNTGRHKIMHDNIIDNLDFHGGFGKVDCFCAFCERLRKNKVDFFGEKVTQEEIDLLRVARIGGDDFFGLDIYSREVNMCKMLTFGTKIKNDIKPVFGTPGLGEDNSAQFLRRHYCLDKSGGMGNPYMIRTYRDSERLTAKFMFGSAAQKPDTAYAAGISLLWEIGFNKDLYDLHRPLVDKLNKPKNHITFKENVMKRVVKTPAVADCSPAVVPEFACIVNADGSMLKPFVKLYNSRCAKRFLNTKSAHYIKY